MDYSKCDANQIQQLLAGEHPEAWLAAARAWGKMAVAVDNVATGITIASSEITVWRQSNDSKAQAAFDGRINRDLKWLPDWGNYGRKLTVSLQTVGDAIGNARVEAQHWVDERKKQVQRVDDAKNDTDRMWAQIGVDLVDYEAQQVITHLAGLMAGALSDKDGPPTGIWDGPRAVPDAKDQPQDKGDPAGTGADKGGGGGDSAQTTAAPDDKTPADKKPDDKTSTDPVDEAGKIIDVVGKGIDLIGKVPDNLDKWITLAQHAKDLVDPSTTTATTPTVTTPSAHLPLTDSPALAGGAGTTTAPTFHTPSVPTVPNDSSTNLPIGSLGGAGGIGALGKSSVGGASGTSERTNPVEKSATVAGATGTEPQLSGKTSTTASTGTQQSTPPMYPPQNGGMGAGGNGVRDIKPGAGRRPGFNVPADQSEAERLRRQGVQPDLQGRTNGESRTASGVPPLRKRRRSAARAVERDVLDEDLWRI